MKIRSKSEISSELFSRREVAKKDGRGGEKSKSKNSKQKPNLIGQWSTHEADWTKNGVTLETASLPLARFGRIKEITKNELEKWILASVTTTIGRDRAQTYQV